MLGLAVAATPITTRPLLLDLAAGATAAAAMVAAARLGRRHHTAATRWPHTRAVVEVPSGSTHLLVWAESDQPGSQRNILSMG